MDRSHLVEGSIFCLLLSGFLFCTTAGERLGAVVLYSGYGFALGLAGLVMARYGRGRLLWPPELLLFGMFAAWALLTGVFMAPELGAFLQMAERLVEIVLLASVVACYCASVRSPLPALGAVWILALTLVANGLLSGDFGLASELNQHGTRVTGHRAASFAANANSLGMVCMWGLGTLALLWGTRRGRTIRIALLLLALPLLEGVVYSASRKAVVLVFVFAAAFLWFCYRRLVMRRFAVFAGALLLLVALVGFGQYVFQHTLVAQRLSQAAGGGEESAEMRLFLVQEGLRVLAENPVAGVGLGGFAVVNEIGLYSHSEYIEVATSTGLVGLAMYLGLYVSLWRRLSRIRKVGLDTSTGYLAGACQALFVIFMVGNLQMVAYSSFPAMAMFGGLLGFAYGTDRHGRWTTVKGLQNQRMRRGLHLAPPFGQSDRSVIQPHPGPSPV
ncbi:MAG: O-antigen ligase family protein [Planctomycetes bacterium]|nr:O-antigen ligase family protein [Planctomycetota bacterium]